MDTRRTAVVLTAAVCLGLAAFLGALALVSAHSGATVVSRDVNNIELPSAGLFGGKIAIYAKPSSAKHAPECTLLSRTGRAISPAKVRSGSGPDARERNGVTLRRVATVTNPPGSATLSCSGLVHRQPAVAVAAATPVATPALLTGAGLCLAAAALLPVAILRGLKVGPRTSLLGR